MDKPKVIALYLPQFHPTPDNDRWWGKGFTEWTNVGKAKALFRGHNQPNVPADLGYYDLRLPEVRAAQAQMARDAGIYGFCYYHYWFGNGKEALEMPFDEVVRLGEPDFPFMLCWANESWHKKFWDKDGKGSSKEVLAEQTYPGRQDVIDHFYRLLPAFKDPRYIKMDGKLAFMIYKPLKYDDVDLFINEWQSLAEKEGLPGFTFLGHMQDSFDVETKNQILSRGFRYCNTVSLYDAKDRLSTWLQRWKHRFMHRLFNYPIRIDYNRIARYFETRIDAQSDVIPSVIPNWDHTPRSGVDGWVLTNSNPSNFRTHLRHMIDVQNAKNIPEKYIFLKSWNEWGEGNYVEPDLRFGRQYLDVLAEELK